MENTKTIWMEKQEIQIKMIDKTLSYLDYLEEFLVNGYSIFLNCNKINVWVSL